MNRMATRSHPARIAVVGSVNIDTTLTVMRTPSRGETVLASGRRHGIGGKGANQAVGCARLGHHTAMVACVGDDAEGGRVRARLRSEGIATECFQVTADEPTGTAVVLSERGESTIVVSPGANARLSAARVLECPTVAEADAVLCQLEVPIAAIQAAAECSRGLLVLNPAPARPLASELLERVDVLIPNQHELAVLVDADEEDRLDMIAEQARSIQGPQAVVVSLGARGALVVDESGAHHVPTTKADLIDATAAGDSFCAAVVDGLLQGLLLTEAVRWGNRVASLTVTRPGAIDSLPGTEELAHLSPAANSVPTEPCQ